MKHGNLLARQNALQSAQEARREVSWFCLLSSASRVLCASGALFGEGRGGSWVSCLVSWRPVGLLVCCLFRSYPQVGEGTTRKGFLVFVISSFLRGAETRSQPRLQPGMSLPWQTL